MGRGRGKRGMARVNRRAALLDRRAAPAVLIRAGPQIGRVVGRPRVRGHVRRRHPERLAAVRQRGDVGGGARPGRGGATVRSRSALARGVGSTSARKRGQRGAWRPVSALPQLPQLPALPQLPRLPRRRGQ